jgi:hypothetical protein
MKRNLYSLAALLVFALLFWASSTPEKLSKTLNTYEDVVKKESEPVTVSYKLPIIKPTGKTTQEQIKGSTSIAISIIPFEASRNTKSSKSIFYADPSKPGYDIFEVTNTPEYIVTPEVIRFKMKVSNSNEDVPLELSKITFALFIDGTVWDFPEKYEKTWEKGLVSSVSPKEFIIDGPQLAGLYSAKDIMLNLSGVPTDYDKGGYVTKKEKFVWYFNSSVQEVSKEEKKSYTYETKLIESKRCDKCSGTGTDPQLYQCSTCKGKGTTVNIFDGKTYKCSTCSGTGVVHVSCPDCGGRGTLYFPKSHLPAVTKSVSWDGSYVKIKTLPANASIKLIVPETGQYKVNTGYNGSYPWYCTYGKSCPIIVEYNGKEIKVLPFTSNGKASKTITVDFTKGNPVVTGGTKVE